MRERNKRQIHVFVCEMRMCVGHSANARSIGEQSFMDVFKRCVLFTEISTDSVALGYAGMCGIYTIHSWLYMKLSQTEHFQLFVYALVASPIIWFLLLLMHYLSFRFFHSRAMNIF